MKRTCLFVVASLVVLLANAAAPNGSGTYYQNANGKKGSALKTALCGIIYNRTEKSYNYLWTAFQTTDKRSDGFVWDMYSNITNFTFGTDQAGNYKKEGDVYNREHSFPKSWFGGEVMPMYSDLHHMYPTDGYVNNQRGNYPFGETNGEVYKSANNFSKLGACTYSGYTGRVFEPADEYKGDFARTYFYMVTCYEEKLADWYSKNSESRATIDGSTYPAFQTWQLNMLMEWATADPVSEKEINRNNAVYGIQNNRNPFIDYPGLEQYIWGSKKDDTFSYNNYEVPDGSSSGGGDDPDPGTNPEPSGDDKTITLTYESFGLSGYAVYNATVGGYSFTVNQGFKGEGNTIQMNSSKGSGILYNTTAIPGLKSITVNVASGSKTYTITTGTSQTPTTNSQTGTTGGTYNAASGDTYFQLKVSGACYFSSIVITYNEGGDEPIDPSFNGLSDLSVNWKTPLTLTQGTTGTPNFLTDGTVTLTSLNEAVATVDGLIITPHAVGTAMITVNTAATDAYNAGSVMFPITVLAPEGKTEAAPSATTIFTETFAGCTGKGGNDGRWSGNGTATGTATTDNDGWYFLKENGASGCIKLGASSGTGKATTPALGEAGTLYLSFRAGAWDHSSEKTTLNLSVSEGNISATSVELTKGKFNTYNATITNATAETKITFQSSQASNNRFFLDDVVVTKAGATLTKTLNDYGYASYCSEYPLDFSDYESADYSAWQVTGVSGETITFAQVTGTVKGGTGLILKGEPGATITLNSAASETTLDGNLLVGTIAPTYADAGQYFGLKGNEFVPVAASTVPMGKALLPASLIAGDEVKVLNFVFEDEATRIGLTPDPSPVGEGSIYNLAGQRLQKMQRGINIVNGKKILK
ncbi:MAG: endonuclease [Bacteroidaceae bacterium]|nr:endonuclease [Bacteroidaceae bacterium]